jgi:4-hydroxybenzoate polyprenyltransferase
VAIGLDPRSVHGALASRIILGLLSVCLVASSNYTINEVLDAPFDRRHPTKYRRPVPSGRVSIPLAYVQWIGLMAAGLLLGARLGAAFLVSVGALWVMGCVYNIPPIRSKDLPYVDVLSEAVNNPLRMLAGWYLTGTTAIPPLSLLLSYWMVGCYFMALKRYAEVNDIGERARAAAYRKSFHYYTAERLMVSVMFYATASMLFLGAFSMRYKMELVLAFPFIALVMAIYLSLAFRPNSAVQRPEGLYREPALMTATAVCTAVIALLMMTEIPIVRRAFAPTVPTMVAQGASKAGMR